MDDSSEKCYEVSTYKNSSKEPLGLTIKGKSKNFISAHGYILENIIKGKSLKTEKGCFKISDTSRKNGMTNAIIEINVTDDELESVELKIYDPSNNKKKGATIELRKMSDSDFFSVEKLCEMITSLLDDAIKNSKTRNCSKGGLLSKDNYYVCDDCNWKTRFETALKAHQKRIHGKKSLNGDTCELCDFTSKSKATMIVHKRISHKESKKRSLETFKCSRCDSTFDTKEKLDKHVNTQHAVDQIVDLSLSKSHSLTSSPPRKKIEVQAVIEEGELESSEKNKEDVFDNASGLYERLEKRIKELEMKQIVLEDSIVQIESEKEIYKSSVQSLSDKLGAVDKKLFEATHAEVHPMHVEKLNGFKYYFKTTGNGRCLENAISKHMYDSEYEAENIKRKVYDHIVNNYEPYYKDKICLPYSENIGVGPMASKVEIRTSKEMIDFLKSEKSLLAFSQCHELVAIANVFRMNIHIFTYKRGECYWSKVLPDPDFNVESSDVVKDRPDVYLYHSFEDHYDLLIGKPRNEQQIENLKTIVNVDDELLLTDDSEVEKKGKDMNMSIEIELFKCTFCNLECKSKAELGDHMSSHEGKNETCEVSESVCNSESNLKEHKKSSHDENDGDYTCNDCSFQTNDADVLIKHLKITTHQPSRSDNNKRSKKDYSRCYTCDLAVEGYWDLMNHRKIHHPSNKKCKNFPNGKCRFAENCWYIHEEDLMDTDESFVKNENTHTCYNCDKAFKTKNDMKKHRKKQHLDQVKKCKEFITGGCLRSDEQCWFVHQASSDDVSPQVFHNAQHQSIPPDQVKTMIQEIESLHLSMTNVKEKLRHLMK